MNRTTNTTKSAWERNDASAAGAMRFAGRSNMNGTSTACASSTRTERCPADEFAGGRGVAASAMDLKLRSANIFARQTWAFKALADLPGEIPTSRFHNRRGTPDTDIEPPPLAAVRGFDGEDVLLAQSIN